MDSGFHSSPMQRKWNLRWRKEAFTRTIASGLRTRTLASKQSTETRKQGRSKPPQAVSFLTKFGRSSLDFSTDLLAKSNLVTLSGAVIKLQARQRPLQPWTS